MSMYDRVAQSYLKGLIQTQDAVNIIQALNSQIVRTGRIALRTIKT